MARMNDAEVPQQVCVACGRVGLVGDNPCRCGNEALFVRLKDCGLIFFRGIPIEAETPWESELLALSA